MDAHKLLSEKWKLYGVSGPLPKNLLITFEAEITPMLKVCSEEDPYILMHIDNIVLRYMMAESVQQNIKVSKKLENALGNIEKIKLWLLSGVGFITIATVVNITLVIL